MARKSSSRTVLGLNPLESRSLMAAGLNTSLVPDLNPIPTPVLTPEQLANFRTTADVKVVGGELVVDGSGFNDVVNISRVQNTIRVETNAFSATGTPRPGLVRSFDLGQFDRVVFRGFGGNDVFTNTSALNVTAFGGAGNDALRAGDAPHSGFDQFDEADRDNLFGEAGNDILIGGTDVLFADGGLGNDTLEGQQERSELRGGAGQDVLRDLHGEAELLGVDGNDTLTGHATGSTLRGDGGNDTLNGGASGDFMDGGDGDDVISGLGGADLILGGDGNDLIYAGAGDDQVDAGGGNDIVHGEDGNDFLAGNFGEDTLYGGAGDDELYGDFPGFNVGDNDVMWGGLGNDYFEGGGGFDWIGAIPVG